MARTLRLLHSRLLVCIHIPGILQRTVAEQHTLAARPGPSDQNLAADLLPAALQPRFMMTSLLPAAPGGWAHE